MKLFKKNENKETVKLPMSGKVKKGFRFYCVAVMATALDRKSTRLNSSHYQQSRMPSSA